MKLFNRSAGRKPESKPERRSIAERDNSSGFENRGVLCGARFFLGVALILAAAAFSAYDATRSMSRAASAESLRSEAELSLELVRGRP